MANARRARNFRLYANRRDKQTPPVVSGIRYSRKLREEEREDKRAPPNFRRVSNIPSRHDVQNLNVKIFLEPLTLLIREWYGYTRHTLATFRNVGG